MRDNATEFEQLARSFDALAATSDEYADAVSTKIAALSWRCKADAWRAAAQLTRDVAKDASPKIPSCSVCNDNPAECSRNYSGGWIGTKCPDQR